MNIIKQQIIKYIKKSIPIIVIIILGFSWIKDRSNIENNADIKIENLQQQLNECQNINDNLKQEKNNEPKINSSFHSGAKRIKR